MNCKKRTKLMVMVSFVAVILASMGGFAISAYAKTPQLRQDTSSYIGLDAAKNAALAHAGVQENDTHYCNRWLEYENKLPAYYNVEFLAGSISYEYEIDLYNGAVLNCATEQLNYSYPPASVGSTASGKNGTSNSIADIGQDAAKQVALNHAGISETQASKLKIKREHHDGRLEYKVEFKYGKEKYKYTIDASTGDVLKLD